MAIKDYRFDPFLNVFNAKQISDEQHQIPTASPYTIRLNEVPQKTDPTTLRVNFVDGADLTEVAALPGQGQYWPDYLTVEHGVENWNTGTLLFNATDAGKNVVVSYNGIGTLTDDRIADMLEVSVTSSIQPEREAIVTGITSSADSSMTSGSGDLGGTRGRIRTHRGLVAGT